VRSIGADKVIDYTTDDFAKDGETYDIILDTTGTASLSRCEGALRPGGRLLLVMASFVQTLGMERPSRASGKKVVVGVAKAHAKDLTVLAKLAETGELKPVVDRSYPLESVVEAHAYVDTGRKRGNVVLRVGADSVERGAVNPRFSASAPS
jgi:NADPH:quinone reductase-like Zn-dependent oxidoreductase